MTTHLSIGRTLLAADAAERGLDMRGLTVDQIAAWLSTHRRSHLETAERAIRHHGLLEIDFPDFLARMRCAVVEAGMLHAEEPGERDDWFRVGAALEELVSVLDTAQTAAAAREARRREAA